MPVTTKQMDLSELTVKAAKTEHVRTVEASLRLDAIASAGFRVSRAKASDLVKHGDVRRAPLVACSKGNIQSTGSAAVKKGGTSNLCVHDRTMACDALLIPFLLLFVRLL